MSTQLTVKSVKLPSNIKERVERVTEQTGTSFSEITRRALVAYLDTAEKKQAVLAAAGL